MSRWKMNRLGFVNFWLYGHQTFPLSDGKLLLRGQNASGKSITTQSFIPFILDGDRTPSRLDPFGSSDRKMDYYFLDSQEKDDSTGYLYLEFHKPDTDQYKTIGIGQRAVRGKSPMQFWGFILNDGRRIDHDLKLYKEYGSDFLPLDKKECKALLGEHNFFTESNREYKERVGKEIFGFDNVSQYEQFIRLLIKIRAPKLSKEFKPSKVYEILNDSLQTLADEDISTIVSSMQKMDEIALRLQELKRTERELKYITDEYQRYNNYMLGKKAAQWKASNMELSSFQASVESNRKEIARLQKRQIQLKESTDTLQQHKNVLEAQNDEFANKGIEDQVQRREHLINDAHVKRQAASQMQTKIEELNAEIYAGDREKKKIQSEIDAILSDCRKQMEELDKLNVSIQFLYHNEVRTFIKEGIDRYQVNTIKNQLTILKREIQTILGKLEEIEKTKRECDAAEELYEQYEDACRKAARNEEQAIIQVDEEKDHLIEQYYIAKKENQEFHITDEVIQQIVQVIKGYQEHSEQQSLATISLEKYKQYYQELQQKISQFQIQISHKTQEIKAIQEQITELKSQKESVPVHSDYVEKNRQLLKENGIAVMPFYEGIEFDGDVSEEKQAVLEQQLEQAGVLDALVIAEKDYARAETILEKGNDVLLKVTSRNGTKYPYFKTAETLEDDSLKEAFEKILCTIGTDETSQFQLFEDGSFENGILKGYLHESDRTEIQYIGREARHRNLLRKIAELEQEQQTCAKERDGLSEQLNHFQSRSRLLEEEYDTLPSCASLDQSIQNRKDAQRIAEQAMRNRDEKEKAWINKREELLNQQTHANEQMKKYSYGRTLSSYQEIHSDVEEYEDILTQYTDSLNERIRHEERYDYCQNQLDEKENLLQDRYSQKKELTNEIEKIEVQIQSIDEFLNQSDTKNLVEQIQQIRHELEELAEKIKQNEIELALNQQRLTQEETLNQQYELALPGYLKNESILKEYFLEEVRLGFVLTRETKEEEILNQCDTLIDGIRESDREKDSSTMVSHLIETIQKHSSDIATTGLSAEDQFGISEIPDKLRNRKCITAVMNGKKIGIVDFKQNIADQIERTEYLIQENDRELFEKILTDTVSHKLTGLIQASKEWIDKMSLLMQGINSSMGLTFSLKWIAKNRENEDYLSTKELEKILARPNNLVSDEDVARVGKHFKAELKRFKQDAIEKEQPLDYRVMVSDILDYRKWFEFRMSFERKNEQSRELTDRIFNTFSGGEKAMAMYIPLFAAVNAQYQGSRLDDYPRLIALDEAFAGIDDKNINAMFQLVEDLDFDYIMNSQVLWGCYESVKSLRIAELLRPENAKFITVILYHWNGNQKVLDE